VVEYGNGIHNGPAGQVGGGAGTPGGHPGDLFASLGHVVNDVVHTISTAPPEMLVLGIVIFIVGLAILKRAF
jgi:hypothetical protein